MVSSGCAPTNSSMTSPSLKSLTAGILITEYLPGVSVFSSTIVLVLLTMRDLQNLMLGGRSLAIESGQQTFDLIGSLRYYNQHLSDLGISPIPKGLKKYRLGLHKPGEKPNVVIIDTSKQ